MNPMSPMIAMRNAEKTFTMAGGRSGGKTCAAEEHADHLVRIIKGE